MKTSMQLRLALAAGLVFAALPAAQAAGTAAGTSVANSATLDYDVGGVPQTQMDSNGGTPLTFVVDRRIDVNVAEVGGAATTVVPGADENTTPDPAVTRFTVTNLSNSTLDLRLSATQMSGGATPFDGETDNFDIAFLSTYLDDGDGVWEPAQDTATTYIDELSPDTSRTIWVVGTVPNTQVNGDAAGVILTAVAAQSTNGVTGAYVATVGSLAADAAETNVGSADDPTFIDTVFGDGQGTDDGDDDGADSDRDQFNVVSAAITFTKTSRVVTDPFNCATAGDNTSCTSTPKAIPGAIVEYCLDVNNTGTADADSISLVDPVPAGVNYVAESIRTAVTGTGTACDFTGGAAEDDNAVNADAAPENDPDGGNYDGVNVNVTSPTIPGGSRFRAAFRVEVPN